MTVTKKQFLHALRKGEYKQYRGGLRWVGVAGDADPEHCCIGCLL